MFTDNHSAQLGIRISEVTARRAVEILTAGSGAQGIVTLRSRVTEHAAYRDIHCCTGMMLWGGRGAGSRSAEPFAWERTTSSVCSTWLRATGAVVPSLR
jgi:hypothetical protein